jgi:hypothetical protein
VDLQLQHAWAKGDVLMKILKRKGNKKAALMAAFKNMPAFSRPPPQPWPGAQKGRPRAGTQTSTASGA